MSRSHARHCVAILLATTSFGCGGSNTSNTGGETGQGGLIATGGVTGSPVTVSNGGTTSNSGSSNVSVMGGAAAIGGSGSLGGTAATGGALSTGGKSAIGGNSTGGNSATGGAATGGIVATSSTSTGGNSATAGTASGGTTAGGTNATGGATTGGTATAGTKATGGAATGGTKTTGGTNSTGGSTAVTCPCDIYASGNTPCVAAHSTVRALLGAYSGNLYQVRRASDNTTKDIGALTPGGFANAATQDTFCSGTTCTISIIYDQSGNANHLTKAPAGGAKKSGDNEASATALKLTVGGHAVYGVHIPAGVGYRIDKTSGIATGDKPESMYMVTSGNYYNNGCCFDYGNAETDDLDDGNGTMEAIYFGNCTGWGKGSGSGPWVMADLENGLFAGVDFGPTSTNPPLTSTYVTAMVTGRSGSFAIKGGNSQSGSLKTMYDGARPANGYNPMKKQGAIILGIGGDNSNNAQGNFFEGCMTAGASSIATDDAIQANIVAAGYGG